MLKGLTSTFRNNCNNIELTYKEYIVIEGQTIPVRAKLSDDCYENGNFIGSFILKIIQFETSNDVKFRNKEFEYYKVVDGESIKIGTFITTEIEDNDTTELIKVVGMDYGLKTQVQYTSALDYESGNVTLMDVWNECCQLSGLESGVDDFENSNFIVDSDQFTGTGATIRDVFIGIALSSGSFIKVMNDDKIYPIFKTHTEDLLEATINTQSTIENVLEIDKIKELSGDTFQQTYTGKNKLNLISGGSHNVNGIVNNDGTISIQGKANSTTGDRIFASSQTIPAGTYTLSISKALPFLINFVFESGVGFRLPAGTTSLTITTTRSYTEGSLFMAMTNGTTYNETFKIQIVSGSTADYDFEPYVGGIPSPNPNYPQSIQSATGLQNIKITSENLKDSNNIINAYLNTVEGIHNNNNNRVAYIPIEDNTTYTINKVLSARFRIGLTEVLPVADTPIYEYANVDSQTSYTFTNTNYKYLCIWFWNNTDTLTQQEIFDSLNIYTQSTSYKVNLGKNLFDKDNGNYVMGTLGVNYKFEVGTTNKCLYIPCKPNTTYTVQKRNDGDTNRFAFSSSEVIPTNNSTLTTRVGNNDASSLTLTTGANDKYLIVQYYRIYETVLTEQQLLDSIQIEVGSQATTYSPYFTPIELNKIDIYEDRIYKDSGKWYIEKNTRKTQLAIADMNNSENYPGWKNQTQLYNDVYNGTLATLLSNYTLFKTNIAGENAWVSVNFSNATDPLLFLSRGYYGQDHTQTYWKTNYPNLIFSMVYRIKTPEITEITNEELINQLEAIQLLKGTNTITITSNDLTGGLKLSYWNDNSELVEDYTELEDKRDTRPISCVRLGMSQIDGENVDMIDEDLVEEYGENWLILNDNPFAYNQEKRQQLITAIFNKVKGFGYSAFVSKTSFKPYMTCGDTLKFKNRNGDLVDSILLRYSHDYKEDDMQIQLEAPSETSATVNYVYPLSAIDMNKRTQIEVDKDKVQITNLTSQTTTIQDNLSNNYYTKDQANTLVQTAQTGLTNTFSEAGGNNIFRNTGLWFTQNDQNNPFEFWNGNVVKAKEEKASNYSALLLQNSTLSQEQIVANGNYTISFKYKKLVQLAEVKCIINDIEIELDSLTDKEIIQVLEVSSQHINIQFISDTTNSCEIYDLMVNAGSVKLAYSQNQNETTTDTVNISKGITITSSDVDVTFKANADGIRTLDRNGNRKTEFTDTGMITTRATIEEEAEIVGLLHKRVGNHIWVTKL